MLNQRPAGRHATDYAILHLERPAPAPRRSRWPKAVALAVGFTVAAGAMQWSMAQRRDGPRIVVAPTILAEPASQASFTIQVGPPEALPNNSFVRLRGFPASVSLSEGHAISPGAWAIPLFGLQSLKAIVPAGLSGRAEILISLVGVDGITLAESKTALVIAAPPPPPAPPRPIEPSRQVIEPLPPRQLIEPPPARQLIPSPGPTAAPSRRTVPTTALSGEDRARAERMLSQGTRHLEQGNISAARMFFQHAAEVGLAAAALKMGATYDPMELTRVDALAGVNSDRNEARKWYERARDLGAQEADERLSRLTGR